MDLKVIELLSENELKKYSRLLDNSFMSGFDYPFFDDFPVWDPNKQVEGVQRFGIVQGSHLLSTASLRIAQLRLSDQISIRVGIIGAVATQPEFRNQGLSRFVVDQVLNSARDAKVSLLFVWGSEHSFYQKLGFDLCGEQWQMALSDLKNDIPPSKMRIHCGWNPSIFEMRKNLTTGLILRDSDEAWFRAHKNVTWYTARQKDHLTAYLGIGRGVDLADIVHEWGGSTKDLTALLHHVRSKIPQASLICPAGKLREYFEKTAQVTREFLCLAKILDPMSFIPQDAGIQMEWSKSSQEWVVRSAKGELRISSSRLSKAILGDPHQQELNFELPFYPTSVWIWGLDSA